MSFTNFPNGVTSFGIPVLPAGIPVGGDVYFLDPANGNDGFSGKSPEQAFKTLAVAEDALTANQNDVLYYIAGSSSITLSAAVTWDKSYTHFIGLCAPTMAGQRARIYQLSTLTAASPLITVSASGCIFANLYAFQGVADAGSLINVSVTGGRNYFYNVHFAGGGHVTQAITGGASLKLDAAEENTFERCTIGVDTVAAATGMSGLIFDTEAHRNIFINCHFTMYAGHAGARFITVADATGIDRYNIFKSCIFSNTSATAMTSAVVAPAGMAAPRRLYFMDTFFDGAGDIDASDRGICYQNTGTITLGGNAGLFGATVAT